MSQGTAVTTAEVSGTGNDASTSATHTKQGPTSPVNGTGTVMSTQPVTGATSAADTSVGVQTTQVVMSQAPVVTTAAVSQATQGPTTAPGTVVTTRLATGATSAPNTSAAGQTTKVMMSHGTGVTTRNDVSTVATQATQGPTTAPGTVVTTQLVTGATSAADTSAVGQTTKVMMSHGTGATTRNDVSTAATQATQGPTTAPGTAVTTQAATGTTSAAKTSTGAKTTSVIMSTGTAVTTQPATEATSPADTTPSLTSIVETTNSPVTSNAPTAATTKQVAHTSLANSTSAPQTTVSTTTGDITTVTTTPNTLPVTYLPQVPTFSASSTHAWVDFESRTGGRWDVDTGHVDTASVTIDVLNQRNEFDIDVDVEGFYSTTYDTVSTPLANRASLGVVLRTDVIYADADKIGIVVWPQGPGFGPTNSYQVKLLVENDAQETKTLSCGSKGKTSFVTCQPSLSKDAWFSTSNASNVTVTAYIVGTTITAAPVVVKLAPTSSSDDATDYPDVWVELPAFPLVPGSTFKAPMYANAVSGGGADYGLSTWIFDLFLADGASFVAIESSFYGVSTSTDGNRTRLVASKDSSVDASDVTGSKVHIATLQLKISSTFDEASQALLGTLHIDDMVSTSSLKVVDDQAASFFQDGSFVESGFVQVEGDWNVGILSYVSSSNDAELVNLGTSGGETASIVTRLIRSCHTTNSPAKGSSSISCAEGTSHSTVSSSTSCSSDDEDVVGIASDACTAEFSGSETAGGDVNITVTYDDFKTSVALRVWYLHSVVLRSSDLQLNAIDTDCATTVFQQARLSAVGSFMLGDNSTVVEDMDITAMVEFASNDTSVVDIDSSTAVGVAAGAARISSVGASIDIVVNDTDTVSVSGLHCVAVNEISVLNSVSLDDFDSSYSTKVHAQVGHSLTQEGDAASVFAYATFSDDTYQYVQDGITAQALTPTILIVAANATTDAPVEVEVPVGAGSRQGTDMLQLSWGMCDAEVANGVVYVDVDMPAVVAVTVEIDNDVLFASDDEIVVSGLNVDESATVTVTLEFEDGSTQDFSDDARLTLTASDDAIQIDGNVLSVADGTGATEDVVVTASFGDYTNMTGNTTVSVDAYCSLRLVQKSYPECADCGTNKSTIYAFAGLRGGYQQLVLGLKVESCLESTFSYSLDTNVDVVIDNATVINAMDSPCSVGADDSCTLSDGELADENLIGVSAGRSQLTVAWFDFDVVTTFITVSDDQVSVASITIHDPTSELVGEADATFSMKLSVTFSDGSKFKQVLTTSKVIFFDEFLTFESNFTDYMSVSTVGIITLKGNTPGSLAPAITVSDLTGTTSASVALFGNLVAACATYDVDFGAEEGAPYAEVSVGDTFEVPIRINTCDDKLTSFQIIVSFDSTVVKAVKDGHTTTGADWGFDIVYTYNDPATEVQIIGSEASSTVAGTDVLLTTLTFEAVGAGSSPFAGEVVDTVGTAGALLGVSGRTSMAAAGHIFVDVDWFSRGRKLVDVAPADAMEWARARQLQRRRTASECVSSSCGCGLPDLNGDVNADCKFTVSDLDYLKRYIAGDIVDADLDDADYQLRQMNPDMTTDESDKASIDGVDINYILYGLAKMYRFLDTVDYWVTASNEVHVVVRLTDETGGYVTDGSSTVVRAELGGYLGADDLTILTGEFTEETVNGSITVMAEPGSEGNFTLVFIADTDLPSVAFALAIETLDGDGGGANESARKFPFWGTTWGAYGEANFDFVPFMSLWLQDRPTTSTSLTTGGMSTYSMTSVGATTASFSTDVPTSVRHHASQSTGATTDTSEAVSIPGQTTLPGTTAPVATGSTIATTALAATGSTIATTAPAVTGTGGTSTVRPPIGSTVEQSTDETPGSATQASTVSEVSAQTSVAGTDRSSSTTAMPMPVDCVGEWGAWDACSVSCGLGTVARTFNITTTAMHGGSRCDYNSGGIDSAPCTSGECPNACIGDWSEWTTCSVDCGGAGTRARYFTIDLDLSATDCNSGADTLTAACGYALCPIESTTIAPVPTAATGTTVEPQPTDPRVVTGQTVTGTGSVAQPASTKFALPTPIVVDPTGPLIAPTEDPGFNVDGPTPEEEERNMIIIIIVVIVLLLLIIIIVIIVCRNRKKKRRIVAIMPVDDDSKKKQQGNGVDGDDKSTDGSVGGGGGPSSRGRRGRRGRCLLYTSPSPRDRG